MSLNVVTGDDVRRSSTFDSTEQEDGYSDDDLDYADDDDDDDADDDGDGDKPAASKSSPGKVTTHLVYGHNPPVIT